MVGGWVGVVVCKCEDQTPSDTNMETASCVLSKLVHWSRFQFALYTPYSFLDTYIHADHPHWGSKCYYSLVHGAVQEFLPRHLNTHQNAPAGRTYSAMGKENIRRIWYFGRARS